MRIALVGILALLGALDLAAQPPTIGPVAVSPTLVQAGVATAVTFTASITSPGLITGGANLLRVTPTGQAVAILGILHDDGLNGDAVAGDKIFSLRFTLNEALAGRVWLRSSAAFQGQLQRVQSSTIGVDVGFIAFGPEQYVRSTGQPTPVVKSFNILDPTAAYTLRIDSAGVSSASVVLNGVEIVKESEFNANVKLITKPVTLKAANQLSVELRGKPGESLTLQITGVDNAPPMITGVVSPAANTAGWHNSNPTVSFVCSDQTSGIASCTAPVVITAETPGQTVVGTAMDKAGNVATASVTVKLDKTPPAATVVSPADGARVSTSPIAVGGTVSDALSGVAGVTCNGAPANLISPGFSCGVTLTLGANTIAVRATDVAGNVLTLPLALTYTPAPVVTFTAPTNLSFLNITPTTVSGTVSDPTATVTINSLAAPVASGQFSIALPLAEGPNIITATATSTAGATGTSSIEVTLDTTPPRVTITSPPDQFVTTDTSISVTGSVNDIVVGTVNSQQAQVTVNGVAAQVANRTFLAANVTLNMENNVIQAVGRDRVGNAATTQITVTRQAPSPSQIRLLSGNNQTGAIGAPVAAPLVVALTDAAGNPVPNKSVIFKVTQNNGMVSSGGAPAASVIATTNAQGQAQAQWSLGARAGAGGNTVEAYSVGFGGTAIFSATGTQGPAGLIVIDTGNNQIGAVNQPLPKPMIAVVVDSGNNRLANVAVTFTVKQGGGNFGGQPSLTVNTDSDGRAAATLTLGFQEGNSNNLVEATFPQNQGFPAGFTASGRAAGIPTNTIISGVVLDNSNVPIPGVTIRAVLSNVLTSNSGIIPTVAAVQTNAQGQFSIPQAPVGFVKLLVDGSTAQRPGKYPTLDYDMVTVAGQNNTVNMPIYLLPLSTANQLCVTAATGGGTLTVPEAPGFSLTFGPGQVTFPGNSKDGCVSVTVVHPDKVPMTPGFGQQPRFIVTIQPAGALFNPPAPITLPNVDGLKPRAVTEMYSFDHDIGSFVAIGTGAVSDDGQVVRSSPGVGVLKAGWHCGGDPSARGTVADCPPCTFCQGANISSVTCIPDPNQINQVCSSVYNNCFVLGTGRCGFDSNLKRPTGVCEGGTVVPDGTACNSAGSIQAICVNGICTGTGTQCPVNCADPDPLTVDVCTNGVCRHVDPADDFCSGRPAGVPCGLCRNGATCNGSGICSGGNPVGGSCGPCMVGGTCNTTGQCVGATPVTNGTACGTAGICTNGTCRVPVDVHLSWRGQSDPIQIYIRQGDKVYLSSTLTAIGSPSGGTFNWLSTSPSVADIQANNDTVTIIGKTPGTSTLFVGYTHNNTSVGTSVLVTVTFPIIFVHGINSSSATWSSVFTALNGKRMLQDQSFCKGASADFDFCAVDFRQEPLLPERDLSGFDLEGGFVNSAVGGVLAATGATKVILVGHSMGGLASRVAIQTYGRDATVDRLITLGTPHLGSTWANIITSSPVTVGTVPLAGAYLIGLNPTSSGAKSLRTDSAQLTALNADVSAMRRISNTSIVGTASGFDSAAVLTFWSAEIASHCLPVPDLSCAILTLTFNDIRNIVNNGDLIVWSTSQNVNTLGVPSKVIPITAWHLSETSHVAIILAELGL